MYIIAKISSYEKTEIVNVKDKKGRIIEKRIKDYDCCEGILEKTIRFDTVGNKLCEIGNLNGDKFRKNFYYDNNGRIEREVLYEWIVEENFNDSFIKEDKYYDYLGNITNEKIISFYFDDLDTSSIEKLSINKNGDTISWAVQEHLRTEYEWTEIPSYKVSKILSDKLKHTIDTLSVDKIKAKRYMRGAF